MHPQELVDQFEQPDEKVKKLELKVAKLELEADKVEQYPRQSNLKPTTGRPYVLAFVDSGAVPAFTAIVCVLTRWCKIDLCVPASSETMLAFDKTPVAQSSACSTPASSRRCIGYFRKPNFTEDHLWRNGGTYRSASRMLPRRQVNISTGGTFIIVWHHLKDLFQ